MGNPNKKVVILCALFIIVLIGKGQTSSLIGIGTDGRLHYTADSKGNKIPDYSGVGYKNSEMPLPNVAVVKTVDPLPGDNFASVQNAINEVAALPLDADGFRGAILFKSGIYNISNSLVINASGIVLRGEGFSNDGTHFIATKTANHTLINFVGASGISNLSSTKKAIVDAYVPIGAKQVTVAAGHNFTLGDRVLLHRIPNATWISLLGMDTLSKVNPNATNWTASDYDLYYERKVMAVNGNTITLDAPNMDVIDPLYAKAELSKYTSARIEKCGIENLRCSSIFATATDENHAWEAVAFGNIENSWAKDIEAYYFASSAVHILSNAAWITVENCKMLDAKSEITGSRRYSFNVDGQRNLVKNCTARDGRHDFVNGSRTCGPNVFYNCGATLQNNDIGPHHRWSTGILFDNITGNGEMNVQNRLTSGTGHGWAGAQIMFWNCTVGKIIIQDPQGDAQNWAIGCLANVITGVGNMTTAPIGIVESKGKNIVAIPSLFSAQLNDRLTGVLPNKLLRFNANINQQMVVLAWSMDEVEKNTQFIVEHSTYGIQFLSIGQIKQTGASNNVVNYQFQHTTPQVGLNFYRLKVVHLDGTFTYSAIKNVVKKKEYTLKLRSNVVVNELVLEVSQPSQLQITSVSGLKLSRFKVLENAKSAVGHLPTGIYFILSNWGEKAVFFKQ